MSLLNCSECDKEISVTAEICQNCGCKKPFKDQKLLAKDSKKMSYKERRSFQKAGGTLKLSFVQKFSFIVIFVFCVLAIKLCNVPLSPEEQAIESREDLMNSARYTCQFYIEKNINDPSSVEYGRDLLDRIVVEEEPGKWMVQLKLRAKNKFNALSQAKFICKLTHDGEKFHLLSIKEVK